MEAIAFRKYSATYIEATKTCAGTTKFAFIQSKFFSFSLRISFTGCNTRRELPKGDPGNGGLFLPGNFEAIVVADSIGPARHLAVNDNGDIYVKLSHSKKGEGGNVALRDVDKDGKADSIVNLEIMIIQEVFPIACGYTMAIYILRQNLLYTGIN